MRPFRFPRSSIVFMLLVLFGIFVAIEKARSIQLQYAADTRAESVWSALPGIFVGMFVLVGVAAAIGYGILFALGRSGVHRFTDVRPWQGTGHSHT